MTQALAADIAVLGRGPAAYAAGLAARAHGLEVALIGREDPVPHWGETLPAACRPLLSRLGVADELENPAHLPGCRHLSIWGDEQARERHDLANVYGPRLILNRNRFLRRLDCAFRSAGGHVFEAGAGDVHRTADGFRVPLVTEGICICAKALVDATGAAARVSRQLGARRSIWVRQAAIASCYEAPSKIEMPCVTLLEAVEQGWLYVAPLSAEGRAVVWWVTDADLVSRAGKPGSERVAAQLRRSIEASRWVHEWQLRETRQWCARNASVGGLDQAAGDGWVAVGDAALTLDPLSSSGVMLAMLSGMHGGKALAEWLAGDPRSLSCYARMVVQARCDHLRQRDLIYPSESRWPDADFWKRRRVSRRST